MAFAVVTDPIPLRMDVDGVLRAGDSRVTLDTIIGAFNDGATPEEIVQQYPSLDLADIYAILGYYLRRRGEVEVYLRRRKQQADTVRRQNEAQLSPAGLRDRLLARRTSANE